MPTRRVQGRRAVWLLSLLLVCASAGRAVCGCTGEQGHCAGGGSQEPPPACHGPGGGTGELAGSERPEPSAPCAPGHDCCCYDGGTALAQAPVSPAPDHGEVLALAPAPFALLLSAPGRSRAGAVRLRPPRGHAPPLYVVNCSYRC